MSLIPSDNKLLLVEEKALMNNWELFIKNAGTAVIKDKNEEKAYKLKLAYEELISNIIRAHLKPIMITMLLSRFTA